jgi:hypothetical protein
MKSIIKVKTRITVKLEEKCNIFLFSELVSSYYESFSLLNHYLESH